jgi:hypothetical protein
MPGISRIMAPPTMMRAKRLLSTALLGAGVVLVIAGLTPALGSGPTGFIASAALVAALLYAGASWFAPLAAPVDSSSLLVLFNRAGLIVAGAGAGQRLGDRFSRELGTAIEPHVATVFAGASVHFVAGAAGAPALVMVPVRAADGTIPLALLTTVSAFSVALDAEAVSAVV